MDTNDTLRRLIRLNVELEGALRVAEARPGVEAMDVARDKFAEMSALFATLENPPAEVVDDPLTGLKEDEALNGEAQPDPEPTAAEVPLGGNPVETDADARDVADAAAGKTQRGDIRKMLTLNDKFLFRRELFNGSDAELNDTLDLIASMDSLHEAEEYLYDDLQLDPENESVRDFMNILTTYFSSPAR